MAWHGMARLGLIGFLRISVATHALQSLIWVCSSWSVFATVSSDGLRQVVPLGVAWPHRRCTWNAVSASENRHRGSRCRVTCLRMSWRHFPLRRDSPRLNDRRRDTFVTALGPQAPDDRRHNTRPCVARFSILVLFRRSASGVARHPFGCPGALCLGVVWYNAACLADVTLRRIQHLSPVWLCVSALPLTTFQ